MLPYLTVILNRKMRHEVGVKICRQCTPDRVISDGIKVPKIMLLVYFMAKYYLGPTVYRAYLYVTSCLDASYKNKTRDSIGFVLLSKSMFGYFREKVSALLILGKLNEAKCIVK